MSKEKLSAEEIDEVKKRLQEGANFPTETMEGLMIIDRKKAEYLLSLIDETEQLQREREELLDWILTCKNEVFESGKISGRTQRAGQDLLDKHRKF